MGCREWAAAWPALTTPGAGYRFQKPRCVGELVGRPGKVNSTTTLGLGHTLSTGCRMDGSRRQVLFGECIMCHPPSPASLRTVPLRY